MLNIDGMKIKTTDSHVEIFIPEYEGTQKHAAIIGLVYAIPKVAAAEIYKAFRKCNSEINVKKMVDKRNENNSR